MHKHFLVFLGIISSTLSFGQNETQQYQDVAFLSNDSLEGREMGTKGELIAANYIAKRFESIGLKPINDSAVFFQIVKKRLKAHPHDTLFSGGEIEGRNIVGFLDNHSKNTIIIGAHYDHLGWGESNSLSTEKAIHNGADDNASGIASLLYLAEQLKSKQTNNNFLFVAFTGEEKGLLGSNYFVNHTNHKLEDINFMINMDMVGRLDSLRRLAIYGVGTSPDFLPVIHKIDSPSFQFKFDSSGVGPSDHTSFYLNDIPVLHFFTGQHAQYHKPEDDLELINFEGLNDVSAFIMNVILSLDTMEKLEFRKTKEPEKKRRHFKVTMGIMPDYLYDGSGLKIDGVSENRPADNAGLIKGDVVVKIGDIKVNSMQDYMKVLSVSNKGDQLKIEFIRDGKLKKSKVIFD
ncbi:MAG: hypothetical protein ACJASQ_002519 [Crocinitomicaceae bacterium]|jgi:hypothetical protein